MASTPQEILSSTVWFLFVKQQLETESGHLLTYKLATFYTSLAISFSKFGDHKTALSYITKAWEYDPYNAQVQRFRSEYFKNWENAPNKHAIAFNIESPPKTELYQSSCLYASQQLAAVPSMLKCYHARSSVPYRPADVEVVNLDPWIVLYHGVVHDEEIELIKAYAKEKLERSTVIQHDGTLYPSEMRISNTRWGGNDVDIFRNVSKRVEMLTGLSTAEKLNGSDAEQFQVVNYGIGGMYAPHHDYLPQISVEAMPQGELYNSGNRMATWMFYLSDVKAGGATVFPKLGIYVPVVKGAAVFWYNLYRNGTADARTLHAGCPVLIGSKWVANKWIRANGQMFIRRCAIDPKK